MNAQDKAKELVEKFLNAEFNCKECNMPFCDIPCTKLSLFESKQCAIVAVDEMINYLIKNNITGTLMTYWREVKQEIQNL